MRSASSVCNGDHLYTLAEHAIDDEERKPTQQKSSGVADVETSDFGSLRNHLYGSIELASKTQRRGFVAVTVPPLCGLRFVGGGKELRVSGALTIGDGRTKPKSFDVQPVINAGTLYPG